MKIRSLFIGFFIVVCIGFIASVEATGSVGDIDVFSWNHTNNSEQAFEVIKPYVKAHCKAKDTVVFTGFYYGKTDPTKIYAFKRYGEKVYDISAPFYEVSECGAMVKRHFSGEVEQIGPKQWIVKNIKILQ
ncbi:MAG: hypothetical protein WCK32_01595 [Chlorobiaceae bacterium]